MAKIAVAGKGGMGKTAFCALIVRELMRRGEAPILAVDADPNFNLNCALGIETDGTVSDLRDDALDKELPSGFTRTQFVETKLEETIIEGRDFDLLVMGRPEGRGCYCAVNNLLRDFLSRISKRYRNVVIDNEAGMEHLSRRTTDDIDVLFVVTDNTAVGRRAAERTCDLARKLKLEIHKTFLVVNRSSELDTELTKCEIEVAGLIPEDPELARRGEEGMELLSLGDDSPAVVAVRGLVERIRTD